MAKTDDASYGNSDEWGRALTVADKVRQTCRDLDLTPGREWVRQVMTEAADQMRSAVLWAASQDITRESPQGARPYIIAADATRSDAAMVSYFLDFLRNEDLVGEDVSARVAADLLEIERGMAALSASLRRELSFDPYVSDVGRLEEDEA